jgi:hypothetical protein
MAANTVKLGTEKDINEKNGEIQIKPSVQLMVM